ncbi:glycine cleavage system protein GcvH [Pseudomonas kermanshahensis]|jgi:glycine cleavage system H protein|uniref:Glycine cleavage system H protein n=1 Tax=Pseudomonas kermanshahensis TaxID=2745482 RepID=A0ABU8R3F6_9PSED|nr:MULTISPECIES: glycine cleavage system protein GcvH [Pseudomonas]ATP50767.1 glycine cleavage system protein H [Pseudomonas putida]MBC3488424.1 glycine cleavage system protein GcvH [Pseudomonas sp. SWRI50]MBC3497162.1 glycine cleavage system protein GcvH [Pseudomonas sp. SWRI67]MBV4527451.1 glycine cleavage system protein GcvH [Pseudomonas kermanshahensis]MCX2687799.1 glycine cleavage system protein GcvH [Pseudomonas sp. DCB_AW]
MSMLRFTPEHEWLRLEATGELTVGITTYAQEALGDVVFVQLPEPGEYGEGNEVAVLESVKAASNISMPLNGTVVAVNQALADDPELVNASPMQDGWFFRIQVANLADLDTLMDQDGYDRFLADNA